MGGSGTCGGMDGHTREHRRKGEHRRDQTRRRHLHDTVQQSRTWRTGHAHSGGQGDEVGHRGGGHQQDKRGREDAGKRDHHGLQRLHAKDSRDMFSTGRGGDRLLPCDTEAHRRAGRSPAEGEAGSRGGEQTERGGFQAGRGAKGQTEEILQETASEKSTSIRVEPLKSAPLKSAFLKESRFSVWNLNESISKCNMLFPSMSFISIISTTKIRKIFDSNIFLLFTPLLQGLLVAHCFFV